MTMRMARRIAAPTMNEIAFQISIHSRSCQVMAVPRGIYTPAVPQRGALTSSLQLADSLGTKDRARSKCRAPRLLPQDERIETSPCPEDQRADRVRPQTSLLGCWAGQLDNPRSVIRSD